MLMYACTQQVYKLLDLCVKTGNIYNAHYLIACVPESKGFLFHTCLFIVSQVKGGKVDFPA